MSDHPRLRDNHFAVLLVALLLMLIAPMVFERISLVIGTLISNVVFLTAVYAVNPQRRTLLVSVVLAALAIIMLWISYLFPTKPFLIANFGLTAIFLLMVITVMLVNLLRMVKVTFNVICGALCVYLLMGVLWMYLFALVQIIQWAQDPFGLSSVLESSAPFAEERWDLLSILMYHSFVTLTTLGYGDIVPATQMARGLCILEAITGQIFLVVLVAYMVGVNVSQRQRSTGQSSSG